MNRRMRRSVVCLCLALLAACGGASPSAGLPPLGPMPDGATWEGTWTTTFGQVTFQATGLPEGPYLAEYAFAREAAPTSGTLYCNDTTDEGDRPNLMICTTDAPQGHVMLRMQPDGRAFVANWWFDRERWVRWEGQR